MDDDSSARKTGWLLFWASLAIRLLFLVLSDNSDGDAFARVTWARWVVDHRELVPPAELWLPAHFWLLSIPYALGLESQLWPRLMSVVAGAASVPFAYLIAYRMFGSAAALITAFTLAVNPLHIRFSVLTVSEPFVILFVTVGLWGFLGYLEHGSRRHLFLGVAAFNLACGHRLEAWIVVAALPVTGLFSSVITGQASSRTALQRAAVFTILASGFAGWWAIYSWMRFGDPLHLATLNRELLSSGYDPVFQHTSRWYTLFFWPGVLLAALGPLAFFGASLGVVRNLVRGPWRLFALFFTGFLVIYYIQNLRAGMVTDARYALLLLWMLALNLGVALNEHSTLGNGRVWFTTATLWLAVVCAGARLPLGVVSQKLSSITPLARFSPDVRAINGWLKAQADVGSLVLGPGLNSYGPWLSILDDWYPHRELKVLSSPSELAEHVGAAPRGSVVLSRGTARDSELEVGTRASAKHFTEVTSVGPYVIYHWGGAGDDAATR